jgi:hypothetical protein
MTLCCVAPSIETRYCILVRIASDACSTFHSIAGFRACSRDSSLMLPRRVGSVTKGSAPFTDFVSSRVFQHVTQLGELE